MATLKLILGKTDGGAGESSSTDSPEPPSRVASNTYVLAAAVKPPPTLVLSPVNEEKDREPPLPPPHPSPQTAHGLASVALRTSNLAAPAGLLLGTHTEQLAADFCDPLPSQPASSPVTRVVDRAAICRPYSSTPSSARHSSEPEPGPPLKYLPTPIHHRRGPCQVVQCETFGCP